MSFSAPLVCSGISGRSSTISNSDLLAWSRASRRSRVTKPVLRVKMPSNRACSTAFRWGGGSAPIGLEISVELPDQFGDGALSGAVPIGEGVELVDQPLGMDPAQTV